MDTQNTQNWFPSFFPFVACTSLRRTCDHVNKITVVFNPSKANNLESNLRLATALYPT